MLLEDFRHATPCYHMSFQKNPKLEHSVQMLYKFKRGECPESFGLNIAVMAGLPQSVVTKAKQKSIEFVVNLRGIKEVNHVEKELIIDARHLQADSDEELDQSMLQQLFS